MEIDFSNLLLVAAVAFSAPLVLGLAPGLRLPAVVLELVAGIAIGPAGLGWVELDQPVRALSLVGLAFLLFLAGLEIAWNPSIAGRAKSEDTALVGEAGIEVLTRTPTLPELDVDGLLRPGYRAALSGRAARGGANRRGDDLSLLVRERSRLWRLIRGCTWRRREISSAR